MLINLLLKQSLPQMTYFRKKAVFNTRLSDAMLCLSLKDKYNILIMVTRVSCSLTLRE